MAHFSLGPHLDEERDSGSFKIYPDEINHWSYAHYDLALSSNSEMTVEVLDTMNTRNKVQGTLQGKEISILAGKIVRFVVPEEAETDEDKGLWSQEINWKKDA